MRPDVQLMIVDGKKGLDYRNVNGVGFLPDGRYVYKATTARGQFIVVGDQESQGFQQIVTTLRVMDMERDVNRDGTNTGRFDAVIVGTHVAFIAQRSTNGGDTVVVIDGKAIPAADAREVTLSPNGLRYAYAYGTGYVPRRVSIDGKDYAARFPFNDSLAPKFIFSPDSKHVAYGAYAPGQGESAVRGLAVDGTFIRTPQPFAAVDPIQNVTFSPDGRHLFWLYTGLQGDRSAVYLDGVRVLNLQDNSLSRRSVTDPLTPRWSVGADGVLTLIAQDGESIKRFRITPGPETSIETLAAMTTIQ